MGTTIVTQERRRRSSLPLGVHAAGTAPRILLAEDDTTMRVLLSSRLRGDGFEVVEAAMSGAIVPALSARSGPRAIDLVVLDLRRARGLEVLARLRRAEPATPVIAIVARRDPRTRREAERLGATAVFTCPFELDDLRTAVLYWT